jgi:hypothetical protein
MRQHAVFLTCYRADELAHCVGAVASRRTRGFGRYSSLITDYVNEDDDRIKLLDKLISPTRDARMCFVKMTCLANAFSM